MVDVARWEMGKGDQPTGELNHADEPLSVVARAEERDHEQQAVEHEHNAHKALCKDVGLVVLVLERCQRVGLKHERSAGRDNRDKGQVEVEEGEQRAKLEHRVHRGQTPEREEQRDEHQTVPRGAELVSGEVSA